jgi:patatin-like phospholipase/acyl hydrolase
MLDLTNGCFSGGIRGIAELEVLQQIEREMGDKLPLQCFFDLVVGTRYKSLFSSPHTHLN